MIGRRSEMEGDLDKMAKGAQARLITGEDGRLRFVREGIS